LFEDINYYWFYNRPYICRTLYFHSPIRLRGVVLS